MFEDFRKIARALDAPLAWLLGFSTVGFVPLTAAMSLRSAAAVAISCFVGLATGGVGMRAILRPSVPLRLSQPSSVPYITTSRRLGAFYVVAGLIWVALPLIAAASN